MSQKKIPYHTELATYVDSIQRNESHTQLELREQTAHHPYQNMQITRDQGALLSWLVATFQAKLVIEVGVFTGYSSLCMAQAMPVMDYIDENGFIKQIIDILGLPASMIKSDAQVQQIRQERAAEQQQQMEMQQQLAESQMAKNAAPLAKVVQDGSQ